MNREQRRLPYDPSGQVAEGRNQLAHLPLTLINGLRSIDSIALLDSAATINLLPYSLGIRLGAVWEQQTVPLQLAGNVGPYEARALLLSAKIEQFDAVDLIFAWAETDNVRFILGQVNFFLKFNICFYRAQHEFEISLSSSE